MARSETETTVPKGAEYYMKNPNLMESEFTAHLGLDPPLKASLLDSAAADVDATTKASKDSM